MASGQNQDRPGKHGIRAEPGQTRTDQDRPGQHGIRAINNGYILMLN